MSTQVEELGAVHGETQRFECQVVGFPTPTITWYKDETEISDNIRYQIDFNEEQGTIALIIRNVTLADEGLYQCKAENSEGYATTTAYLVVKVDMGAGSAMDYSSMTIEKVSEEEHSQVEVLKTGYQTIIEEVITRVEESEREEIEEKSFAPRITYDKVFTQDLRLKIGATIAFEVTIRGYPRPAVNWFHDDIKLEGSSRISMDFKDGLSFLKVQAVTGEDAGMYKVQAENAIGLDAATFKVVVKAPPSVPRNLCVIEVSKDYALLSWEPPKYDGGEKISGYEIEKSLDGMVFVSAGFVDSTVLRHKLMRLKEGAEYVFRVSAENKIGLGDPAILEKPVVCKLPFDPPTQPRDLSVIEFNKDFVTLEWTEPQSDGGSQIIQYVIEKCDTTRGTRSWTVAGTVDPKELTFRASKLFQGNVYLFRVLAENHAGPGPAVELAAPIMAKLPYDKPLSPQRLQVSEVDSSSVTLSWEAPESDGGSLISGYLIERRDVKRSDYVFVASVEASTLSIKITRLVEGNEYYFRVFAENQVGSSAPCETEKPIKVRSPHETPGCPRAVRVKAYWSDSISIVWNAPEFDGGSALTSYVIEQRDCSGDTWTKAGMADVSVCQFKADNLISGNNYLFRVFAVNQLGLGVEAGQLEQPCTAKMPFDPPFAPILLEVSDVSTDHVTLSWRAPEHDGGSPITGYVIEQRDDLVGIWTLASKTEADVTSVTIAGLPEGQTYFFRVAAVNECGRGSFTETRKPVTTLLPCSKPSKPLNLKALSVWKDYVMIGWDEPSDDGGCLMTGFTIEQRGAQEDTGFVFVATVDGSALQYQVTNLLEGHEYYFRVFSQNSVGLSERPAELRLPVKTCIPCEIPPPPVNVRVTETGDGLISIAWDAPKITEITPISRYLVETCLSVSTNWRGAGIVDGSTMTFNLTGLVEGDYYFVRVFSENESGRSKRAAEICEPIRAKQPSKVPCSPSNLRVTELSKNSVTILWDMPKFDGVSDPTQYIIDMKDNAEGEYADVGRVDGRLNCFTMELFDKGKQYYFRVRSKNSAGYCETAAELDSPVELKDSTVKPFPPENLAFSETTDNSLNLSWSSVQGTKRYVIEQRDGLDGPFFIVSRTDGSTSSVFIDNLLPNQAYTFRIWAENECGRSDSYSEITRKSLSREVKQEEPHDAEASSAAELKLQEPLLDTQSANKSAASTALKELTSEQNAFQFEQTESRYVQRVVQKKILQDESLQPVPLQLTKIKLTETMQITKPTKPMLTELETERNVVRAELKDLEGMPLKPELDREELMAPTTTEMSLAPLDQDIEAIPEPSIATGRFELETTQSLLVKETELEVKHVNRVRNESMTVEEVKQTEANTSEAEGQQVRAPLSLKEVKQVELTRTAEVEQDFLVDLEAVDDRETERSEIKQEKLIGVKELELDLGQKEEMKLQKPASLKSFDETDSVKPRDVDRVESSDLKQVESADSKVSSDLKELGTTDVNRIEQGELKLAKLKSVKELESVELRQVRLTDDVETRQASFKHPEQREKTEPDLTKEKHSKAAAAAAELAASTDAKCVENIDGRLEDTEHQLEVVELDQKKLVEAQVEGILETSSDHSSSELIKIREKEQESNLIKGTEPTEEAEEVSDKLPSKFGKLCVSDVNSDSVTLKWETPLETGGADIISYLIVMRDSSKNKYKKVGQIGASTLAYQVSNLKEGHEYWFRVFAENSFGISKEFAEMETPVKTVKRKKEKIKIKPEEKVQLEIEQDKEKFSEEIKQDFTDKTIDISHKETTIEKVTTEIEAIKEISEIKTDGNPLICSVPASVEAKEGESIGIPCQVKGTEEMHSKSDDCETLLPAPLEVNLSKLETELEKLPLIPEIRISENKVPESEDSSKENSVLMDKTTCEKETSSEDSVRMAEPLDTEVKPKEEKQCTVENITAAERVLGNDEVIKSEEDFNSEKVNAITLAKAEESGVEVSETGEILEPSAVESQADVCSLNETKLECVGGSASKVTPIAKEQVSQIHTRNEEVVVTASAIETEAQSSKKTSETETTHIKEINSCEQVAELTEKRSSSDEGTVEETGGHLAEKHDALSLTNDKLECIARDVTVKSISIEEIASESKSTISEEKTMKESSSEEVQTRRTVTEIEQESSREDRSRTSLCAGEETSLTAGTLSEEISSKGKTYDPLEGAVPKLQQSSKAGVKICASEVSENEKEIPVGIPTQFSDRAAENEAQAEVPKSAEEIREQKSSKVSEEDTATLEVLKNDVKLNDQPPQEKIQCIEESKDTEQVLDNPEVIEPEGDIAKVIEMQTALAKLGASDVDVFETRDSLRHSGLESSQDETNLEGGSHHADTIPVIKEQVSEIQARNETMLVAPSTVETETQLLEKISEAETVHVKETKSREKVVESIEVESPSAEGAVGDMVGHLTGKNDEFISTNDKTESVVSDLTTTNIPMEKGIAAVSESMLSEQQRMKESSNDEEEQTDRITETIQETELCTGASFSAEISSDSGTNEPLKTVPELQLEPKADVKMRASEVSATGKEIPLGTETSAQLICNAAENGTEREGLKSSEEMYEQKLSKVKEEAAAVLDASENDAKSNDKPQLLATDTAASTASSTDDVPDTEDTEDKPRFFMVPLPVNVIEGELMQLKFGLSGIPQPELKFYKDDELLKLRKKDKKLRLSYDVTDDLYHLEISNPTAADAGVYRIEAINKLGSAEADVTVTVFHSVEPKVDDKVSDLLSGEIPQLQTVKDLRSTSTEELTEVKSTQSKELIVRDVTEIVTETQIIKENSESNLNFELEAKSETVETKSKADCKVFETEIGTEIIQVKPDSGELKSVAECNAEAIQTMIENELKSFTEAVTETVHAKVDNELRSQSASETNSEGRLESEAETKIKAKLEHITEVGIETAEAKRKAKEKSKDVEVELNRPSGADVETVEVIGKTALKPENAVKAELVQTKHDRGTKLVTKITTEVKDETETSETKVESSSNLSNEASIKTVEMKTEARVSSETQVETKTRGNFESEVKKETTTSETEAGYKLNIKHDTDLKSGNEIVAKADVSDFSTAKTEAQHVTKSNADIATESEVESEAKRTETIHGEYLVEEISGNLPVFTLKPEPVTVLVGESIQLTWKLTTDFKMEIEWLRNGKKLKAKKDKRIRFGVDEKTGNSFLMITEANLKDVGQYELRVDNEFGRIVQTVFVSVISKPSGMPPMFEDYPKPQVVTEGEPFEIACRVTGDPSPQIQFFKNGELISVGKDDRLTFWSLDRTFKLQVKDALPEDSGEYAVMAVNAKGKTSHSITVDVQKLTSRFGEDENIPLFLTKLVPLLVNVGEDIKLSVAVKELNGISVSWFKDGCPLISDKNIIIGREENVYFLEVHGSAIEDSGEYTCTANSGSGACFCSANVVVAAGALAEIPTETEGLQTEKLETLEKSLPTEPTEDVQLLSRYCLHDDWNCKEKNFQLSKGDIVEVLDMEKKAEWLVQNEKDRKQVCFVPIKLLTAVTQDQEERDRHSSDEEAEDIANKTYLQFMAVTSYTSSEEKGLSLEEDEVVEVLNSKAADTWLCRKLNQPQIQGWVPAPILIAKSEATKLDTRSTQEVFREDVIKISNKQQEATMKRRYALKDLWESERDYVRDLHFNLESYHDPFKRNTPNIFLDKMDILFPSLPELVSFHNRFLENLGNCTNDPDSLADCFLNAEESFQLYVSYLKMLPVATKILEIEDVIKFLKDYDLSIGNVGEHKMSLPQYLQRPSDRLSDYSAALKDFMRYTARANQSCGRLEQAVVMIDSLRKKANDQLLVDHIVNYDGNLTELGPILNHETFAVWKGDSTSKTKEYHVFLFRKKLLLTRQKKSDKSTYDCKAVINLGDMLLNDLKDKKFELCFEDLVHGKYTFEAKLAPVAESWHQLLATLLPKWGKKPEFMTILEDVQCKEGAMVQLTCKAYGQPIPSVAWYFNGNAVSQSADYRITSELCQHTLSIPSISLPLGGEYSVKVWNPYGEDNTKMTLTVKEDLVEPKFTSELLDCNVLLGADAKFSCKISGKPLSLVKWFKDEVELKETDRLKILPVDSQTQILILTQVDEVDLGTYECRAVNKAGSTSSKAKLNITNLEESKRKQAPAFLYGFGDTMAIQDKELCLTVTFSGHPAPQVTWQFQGQNLKTSDEIVQAFNDNSASLKIKSIKPEHAGQYTCCLSNQHGTTEVSSVVSVASSPFIIGNLSDSECFCGKEVSFRCQFKSLPVPDVSWTVNGQEVVESERIAIETTDSGTTLTIKNVVPGDAGNYTCHLVNVAGEASSSAKVTCHLQETSDFAQTEIQKPVFETSIENQQASIGSKTEFSCKFVADECISIKWFKDGAELTPKDNIEMSVKDNCPCLMIKSVEASDAGSYQCTVANSHGKTSCTALLSVESLELDLDEVAEKKLKELKLQNIPPIMPLDKPSLKEIDQNLLEISWLPAELPPTARQTPISYILERKDLNDVTGDWIQIQTDIITTVLNLNEFSPTKDCLYRIRAANQFGISDPSMSVTYYGKSAFEVKTGKVGSHEYLPPKAPKDKPTVTELKDDALRISWQPSELPSGAAETDIWYVVERRCPPSRNWIEIASEVKETEYVMHDYRPEKDYMFRVRAGNDYGLSDPTMSATLFTKPIETPKPVKKKDSNDYKSKVKPRTIWDKPEIIDVIGGALTLRWKPSSLPQYALQTKIWYIVEQRIPPDSDWTKIVSDLTDTELRVKYAVNKDYYFRVRAANEFGIAEPSMPVMIRKKEDAFAAEDENQRRRQKDKTGEDFLSSRRVPDHLRVIPEFIGNTDDTQYGVEGQTSEIALRLKGYPEPKVTWNFHNTRIEMGDKYTSTLSRTGDLVLQIQDFSWSEVGEYKAIVENEFGAAMRTVKIDMADPPTFLEPMKDQVFHLHQNGRLECRVQGIPYPIVKFKKDWRQVAGSHRVKVAREDFDHWSLNIQNAIRTDEGVYECVAENVAGKVYCTANAKITEKSGLRQDVKFNAVPVEDYFHIIDELGRGSYGIVRRLIDKNSGNQYAAKFLRYSDPLVREGLAQELEMMSLLYHNNIVQVIDGYEDKNRLVIVMEIVTGGELFQRLVTEDSLTESEVAFYLRQLLVAVEYMHSQNVIHLDLKPENLLLSSPSSDELKVIDFGFARRYNPNRKLRVKYASPEFCSPEVARDESVTPVADLWSVGVIAYILLTGVSPFYSESSRQTLLKIQEGKAEYPAEIFSELSESAKEFVSKLLEKDPRRRMSATEAIEHPFLQLANHRGLGNRIGLERHKAYMFRRKWERGAAVVRTVVQPKPLSSYLLEVPAVEVDIPATTDDSDRASLTGSVQLEAGALAMVQMMGPMSMISTAPSVTGSGSSSEWGREYEDEDTWYEFSTTSYQTGPETHLFPSKDTGLSLRMAKYRRSAHSTSTSRGSSMRLMKERRDLRDLDKELDSEDPMPSRLRSLWHRKSIMTSSSEGCPPIFKEKIRDKAYSVGDPCTLKVHVIGSPQPVISWYRNDELLTEGGRVRVGTGEDGRHSLTILQTKPNDFGVYKCVARNKHGTVTCRARMLCGDHPSRPGRPHVTKISDREAFLIWEEPDSDGNSYIQSYKIDFYRPGDERWTSATYCIDECALIKRLRPDTTYRFRVSAINKFGPSPYSWASVEVRTKKKGTASLDIDAETKRILLRSRQATSRPSPEPSPVGSPLGSTEDVFEAAAQEKATESELLGGQEILLQETDPSTYVQFGSEVWRGRFSVVLNLKPKEGHKIKRVAKISEYDPENAERSLQEYEMLKAGRQEHVVRLHEAFLWNGFVVLVFEKLFGENVVRSLSLKNRYNEYTVTSIIKQVLDAVQFLHHHGIVHLNIQPDNVIMQSRRRFDVKLIDFGQAHKIATPEGVKVNRTGTAEFMAPEKVTSENVGVAADVWGIGVLTFILLSGISPFYAETEEETISNIEHVRYDAHALYHNITKFGLKFLLQTLKRKPKSRLTVEECLDNRWLMLNQVMVKSRRQAVFSTEKLKLFLDDYITRRMRNTIPPKRLLEAYGSPSDVVWSASDEEDEPFYASNTGIAKRPL